MLSVSLGVAGTARSRAIHEALGFVVTGGDPDHGYRILENGETTLGFFRRTSEGTSARSSVDPDGIRVLVDQHV